MTSHTHTDCTVHWVCQISSFHCGVFYSLISSFHESPLIALPYRLITRASSYQPSWSCHLPPLFLSLLSFTSPRATLPVFFSAHCLRLLLPLLFLLFFLLPVPPHHHHLFWFPAVLLQNNVSSPQRNNCMSVTHVIVMECCQLVLAEWSSSILFRSCQGVANTLLPPTTVK